METSTPLPVSNRLPLHALLLALTLLSVFGTSILQEWLSVQDWALVHPGQAVIFALALVSILGAHEMGHYVLARIHRVDTSLPFFIPMPGLGVGTLGAVIRIRSRIPDRNSLVDIGAAGPLAGLVVAIPVIAVGLSFSTVGPVPAYETGWPDTPSLLRLVPLGAQFFSGTLPELTGGTAFIYGDSLLMQGLTRLVVGVIPPGHDVFVHPLVIAGWFGLLVTMLNLIPIGQLDGGHLTFAWFGRHAQTIGKVMAAGLLYLALFHSASWILWFVVTTLFVRFRHPEVVDTQTPLTRSRRIICVLCLIAFVLCVMPVPIRMVSVP